jgi:hypothetical protein
MGWCVMEVWVEEDEFFPVYSLWSEQPYLAGKDLRKIEVSLELMEEHLDAREAFYTTQRKIGAIVRGGKS